ncbi:hypothetical protein ACCO45_001538 [Purpureocillium lilacinum]|uniref:Uncharacterized protein n=1 Tax=Purpureocillium lilacinum TaxID=33203 RepID=A0ACC4E7B5_PURLI
MAPPAKKRRTTRAAAKAEAEQEEVQAAQQAEPQQNTEEKEQTQTEPEAAPLPAEPSVKPTTKVAPKPAAPDPEAEPEKPSAADAAAKAKERMARDPSQLTALHRKHAIASHKLLKADVEDAGEDFERKRAWDWTIDESEKWDKRLKKKAAHRDNNAFRDNHQESNKVYKRQLKNINLDLENYDKQKMAAIEKAAASGGLDIVEMEDGELIAVDKDGSFYSTADSTSFAQNKPDKAAVDRLVEDLRRADEQRLKKRKERMAKNGDEGDVTYINEKNKQFNQKLSRFYDKYTADIRDSFERGTMI